ncbi:MAG: class I SAM-dependent methyltransferase, partial [Proteobacteria bacterium]|nr:class I SAM-dependent methyltransferase [Pseudomonadota bacterium]
MDEITRLVKNQYEMFPYPGMTDQYRADSFPQLLLSYVRREPREELYIFDAGCGTGTAVVPVAENCPSAQIVALDISVAALEQARRLAEERGVANVRFVEGDINRLDRTLRPDGGFDLIYASGVIHHLADPVKGLKQLAGLMADDGLMVLFLYSAWGRQPALRVAQAMNIMEPDKSDYAKRLPLVRSLLESLVESPVNEAPMGYRADLPDNEVVDRYLHANERAYTIPGLFELLDSSGVKFIRWLEPREWDVDYLVSPGEASQMLSKLDERRRLEVLDLLFDHP